MRRERKPDVGTLGGSALTAHTRLWPSVYRHAERLRINLENQGKVMAWCREHGWTMVIREGGRHWKLAGWTNGVINFVEWWPANAKLVFNGRDDEGVHCHDYQQLIRALEGGERCRRRDCG